MSLTLYTNPNSRGRVGEWMLAEVGVPYEKVDLQYGPEGMKTPEYLTVNPMGKVPALVDNGKVVTEAAAVCMYLADAYPQAGLQPTESERANYYRWIVFATATLEQGLAFRALNITLDDKQKTMLGCGDLDVALSTLADHLAHNDYVAGDRFTAADVYVGSQLNFYVRMFKMVPSHPAFEAYLDRVTTRAAFPK